MYKCSCNGSVKKLISIVFNSITVFSIWVYRSFYYPCVWWSLTVVVWVRGIVDEKRRVENLNCSPFRTLLVHGFSPNLEVFIEFLVSWSMPQTLNFTKPSVYRLNRRQSCPRVTKSVTWSWKSRVESRVRILIASHFFNSWWIGVKFGFYI